MANPYFCPSISFIFQSFIPIIFQLQYQVLFFFLEAVCVDTSGVIGCKSPLFDSLSCSPCSCIKIWSLNCCESPECSDNLLPRLLRAFEVESGGNSLITDRIFLRRVSDSM